MVSAATAGLDCGRCATLTVDVAANSLGAYAHLTADDIERLAKAVQEEEEALSRLPTGPPPQQPKPSDAKPSGQASAGTAEGADG